MSDAVLRVSHVSKQFSLSETHDSLRDLISAGVRRLFGRGAHRRGDLFWALRDVDFEVGQGEAVGVIGPNGAGKSTLLKLMAGILVPDHGEVSVKGRLAALIEVGAGFHGDLTGRENIFLNGAILGMDRSEIRRKLDDIVAFAGLEKFLDMPVKRYSSGMGARLGFSIAAHVAPDVLLVDEVLSVGDAMFRLRCMERMHELVRQGTTLILVSHNLDQVQAICDRAVVLEKGSSVFSGDPRDAVSRYLDAMSRSYAPRPADLTSATSDGGSAVESHSLRFVNSQGEAVVWARAAEPIRAELSFRLRRAVPKLVIELNMRAAVHQNLLSVNSGRDGLTFAGHAGDNKVTLALPRLPVCGGHYFWNIRMWDSNAGTSELDTPFSYPLVIDDEGRATGILTAEHQWCLEATQGRAEVGCEMKTQSRPESAASTTMDAIHP